MPVCGWCCAAADIAGANGVDIAEDRVVATEDVEGDCENVSIVVRIVPAPAN